MTRRQIGAVAVTVSILALSGCSLNTMVWGAEGAGIIDTTTEFIRAAAAGDADRFICQGEHPDLGKPSDWQGLAAEEPEELVPEFWPDQVPLSPDWSINLSSGGDVSVGDVLPGDLFYREAKDGPCIVDVAWTSIESISRD